MICVVITRLRNDRARNVITSEACQQNLRRTCSCELHQAWRDQEAELNRLRKVFESTETYRHQTHDRAAAKALADAIDKDPPLIVHWHKDGYDAACGAHAKEPNTMWVDRFNAASITCDKCRVLLAKPVKLSPPREQEDTDHARNSQGETPSTATLELDRRSRIVRVDDGRRRKRTRNGS